jgi:predicted glycosyltransferase
MGHFFRSVELLRRFAGNDVLLVAGGREVETALPAHVRLTRLPSLYMDEAFTTLIAGENGRSVDQIQAERKERLFSLMASFRPNVVITELYPFGRSFFEFELIPLLESLRAGAFGEVKVVCSLRDVLVEKRNPQEFEQRVLDRLNRFYDLLLVHSDERFLPLSETFGRLPDIRIPVHYTGFVTPSADLTRARELRREVETAAGQTIVVASSGGGRSGYPLLKNVIAACRNLQKDRDLQLFVFTGPFMDDELYEDLKLRETPGIRIRRFTDRFMDYLGAADLSVSMAGYNTCMNLLVTGGPALVYPYSRQREQPLRAAKIKDIIPMRVLAEGDIEPVRLAEHMRAMLRRPKAAAVELNFNGAANTLNILAAMLDK